MFHVLINAYKGSSTNKGPLSLSVIKLRIVASCVKLLVSIPAAMIHIFKLVGIPPGSTREGAGL